MKGSSVQQTVALTILATCLFASETTNGQRLRVLSSDYSLQFVCQEVRLNTFEGQIERFLSDRGFRVLNLGRVQREHRALLDLVNITGIDRTRRIVEFRALPPPAGRYAASLMTPPPTQRAENLEKDILEFVAETLACDVRQTNRGRNDVDAADLHDIEVRRIEGLFRQVDELKNPAL